MSRRLPVHLHEVMMKVRKAEKELTSELRREPSKEEIANKAGISEAKLHGLHKVHPCTLRCCAALLSLLHMPLHSPVETAYPSASLLRHSHQTRGVVGS